MFSSFLLKKLDFEIEFKELKVADYIIKDVAIERKTVSDFRTSMINGRLKNQEIYPEKNNISANALRDFLFSIFLKHKFQ